MRFNSSSENRTARIATIKKAIVINPFCVTHTSTIK